MPGTPFNLIREDWLPVRRADGGSDRIAPWGIVANLSNNPVVAIDWPRPDFNGATLEFLIGLLATAFAPKDKDEWLDRWESPPAPEELRDAFERIAFAFDLDGDGPRFMQEIGELEKPTQRSAGQLLIDYPGEATEKKNRDHFVKRGQVTAVSRPMAAIALYTMQTYSPGCGAGYLASMRGGGPLTTLAAGDPHDGVASLWRLLWPNVPEGDGPDPSIGSAKVFPWLPATGSSRDFPVTTPEHGHPLQAFPLQAFWGMPRRVRLMFEPARGRVCDLGGPADNVLACGWRTSPHGIKYEGWKHPLSPYVKRKIDELPNPVKGNPGGVTYRHWLGLVQEDPDNGRLPAQCVSVFRNERAEDAGISGIRLVAFGYEMGKKEIAKARCWYQAEMPIPNIPPARRESFDGRAAQLVRAADKAASLAKQALRNATFRKNDDRYNKASKFEFEFIVDAEERLWRDTEAKFFDLLSELAEDEVDDAMLREGWLKELSRAALAIFDQTAPSEGLEAGAWRQLVEARKWLAGGLKGKDIRAQLGLAPPPGLTKRAGRKTKGKTP